MQGYLNSKEDASGGYAGGSTALGVRNRDLNNEAQRQTYVLANHLPHTHKRFTPCMN